MFLGYPVAIRVEIAAPLKRVDQLLLHLEFLGRNPRGNRGPVETRRCGVEDIAHRCVAIRVEIAAPLKQLPPWAWLKCGELVAIRVEIAAPLKQAG